MENRLLIEMDRIKSMMSINENTELLNEGAIDFILSRLITKSIATAEEKLILKFFEKDLSKQITSQADKVAFSKFIKSAEGQTFIKEVEAEIAKLTNPNAQRFAQRSLDRMETAATSWENLGIGSRPSSGRASTTPAGRASTTVGSSIAKVDVETIENALESFETTFPHLFQKKWYGSFVNRARIDGIRKALIRDYEGQSAKNIEDIIERKLADAESALSRTKKLPIEKKSLLRRQISDLSSYLKKNPIKGTVGIAVVGGTIAYLLSEYISEWIETGSPITAATAVPFRVWGDLKSGWNRNKPYDNTPDGLLKYVIEKYGDDDYTNKNKYTLTPPNSDGVIKLTRKNGGGTKSFKHNGNTFIEIKP